MYIILKFSNEINIVALCHLTIEEVKEFTVMLWGNAYSQREQRKPLWPLLMD